jgi:hypothetical protein
MTEKRHYRLEAPHGRGGGKGKVQNDPRNYEADLWGTPTDQTNLPAEQGIRRGKHGESIINGVTYAPQRLFDAAEMQIPFPDTLISKKPAEGAEDPGADTLFSSPLQQLAAAQSDLFAASSVPSFDTQSPPTAEKSLRREKNKKQST